MDGPAFDTLTRSFAGNLSRRGVVRRVGLLGLAGPSSLLAVRETAARRKKGKKKKNKRGGSGAPPFSCTGQANGTNCGASPAVQCCDGVCVDTARDEAHCGTCGKRCQLNARCSAGVCHCIGDPAGVCLLVPMYSCCPLGSTCACTDANNSADIWLNPVTCQGVTGCPAARQCLGSQCQTCCPVGTTCDPSTGTCLL